VESLSSSGHAAVSGRLVDLADPGLVAHTYSHAAAIRTGSQLPPSTPPAILRAVAESRRNHGYSIHGYIADDAYAGRNECFYPSGGLMAIRRSAIPRYPQLFPHHFFAYHEDAWLGFDLRSRRLSVGKQPAAVAIHQAGSTSRSLGRIRLKYLQERNRCLNLIGWLPGATLVRLLPLYLLTSIVTLLALIARPADLAGFLWARLWILTQPLELLRWRNSCQLHGEAATSAAASDLSGAFRGRGGLLNLVSNWWCRMAGISTIEHKSSANPGVRQYGKS
jgi:GT2 family glycosyltransferase